MDLGTRMQRWLKWCLSNSCTKDPTGQDLGLLEARSSMGRVDVSPQADFRYLQKTDPIWPGPCDHLRCHSKNLDPLGSGSSLLSTRKNSARLTSGGTTATRDPRLGTSPRRFLRDFIGSNGEHRLNTCPYYSMLLGK